MIRSERQTSHRVLGVILTALLLSLTFIQPVSATSITTMVQAENRDQQIRVYLSRIGVADRMDIILQSPYGLMDENKNLLHFARGSELTIMLKEDRLYVYYQGMSMNMGKSLSLMRYAGDMDENGFRLTNFPALYSGDLRLDIVEGKIRPILTLHVEDYLLGVVPYEMNNSFPLEALKAQAIAARTYALRKQNSKADYDVVDTTNDQVFKGYQTGADQVELAIKDTRGICGFYKGKLAICYYSASNGGQMERIKTVWPTGENLAYYVFGEDKYDVENPASIVRSVQLKKNYEPEEIAPYALRKLLSNELSTELLAHGYDPAPESVRLDAVSTMSVDTPQGEVGSKRMMKFHITVKISGRTRTDVVSTQEPLPEAEVTHVLDPLADMENEEVSLFILETPEIISTPDVMAIPQPTLTSTPAPIYGDFTPINESFTLDLLIFPTVEMALGMDISGNYENELWSIVTTETGYTVEARRFGHGLGMSQRGAQWMAMRYNKLYTDIIAFYYPGLELMQYPEKIIELPTADAALAVTAGPAPTPTPRPTLMPVTQVAAEGQWYATVTEIDDDSTLNLRLMPELNCEIVRKIYKNQRLLVLQRCPEEGWVKVQTDATEGFVMEKFLTKEQ